MIKKSFSRAVSRELYRKNKDLRNLETRGKVYFDTIFIFN